MLGNLGGNRREQATGFEIEAGRSFFPGSRPLGDGDLHAPGFFKAPDAPAEDHLSPRGKADGLRKHGAVATGTTHRRGSPSHFIRDRLALRARIKTSPRSSVQWDCISLSVVFNERRRPRRSRRFYGSRGASIRPPNNGRSQTRRSVASPPLPRACARRRGGSPRQHSRPS